MDIRSASFLFGSADRPDESVKLDTLGMAQTRYWEASLAKTGLDSDEFIDYLMLVPTGAKLHLREVQLAMPVLTDPEAIAVLQLFPPPNRVSPLNVRASAATPDYDARRRTPNHSHG